MPDRVVQTSVSSKANVSEQFPLWIRIVVVSGAVLLTAGALISRLHPILLVPPDNQINSAVRVYAAYTFSRDLALAIMLVTALLLRARATLNSLMLLTGFIQLFDAFTDCFDHRWPIVPATVVIGALFYLGSATLSGAPFWKIQAWRQTP
jgi:hypothetical protein